MSEIKSLKEQFEEQIGAKVIGKFEPVVLHDGSNWTDEGAAYKRELDSLQLDGVSANASA